MLVFLLQEFAFRAPPFLSFLFAFFHPKGFNAPPLESSMSFNGPPFLINIVGFLPFTARFAIAITKRYEIINQLLEFLSLDT